MLSALLFVLVFLGAIILSFISSPVFAFVLYEIVYFFNPPERFWGNYLPGISYPFITSVFLIFSAVILNKKNQSPNKLLSAPPFKWIYLLIVVYGCMYFVAVFPDDHLTSTINFLKLIIIISFAYKLIDTTKKLDLAIYGYIFGCWYISFLTWQTGRNSGDRVEGIGTVDSPDANGIAAAIAPAIVISLYYFWISKTKTQKILFALAGAFIANGLILINSRASFLAVAISLSSFMLYMYFSKTRKQYQTSLAIFITVAGLSGALYLADESFLDRIKTITQSEVSEEQVSGATRVFFWLSAWDVAVDHPLGSGINGYNYYSLYYMPEDVRELIGHKSKSVHSTWMEVLTEVGFFGAAVFAMMLLSTLLAIRKCMEKFKKTGEADKYYKMVMLQSAFLAFLIAATFMNRFRAEILYWIILYSACAYNIYILKNEPSSDQDSQPEKVT